MQEHNPIDSLFRDALKEAELPAPDGVFQAVQGHVNAAASAGSGAVGVALKVSLWSLAAGAIATAVWWTAGSSADARAKEPIATESVVPAAELVQDTAAGLVENQPQPVLTAQQPQGAVQVPAEQGADSAEFRSVELETVQAVKPNLVSNNRRASAPVQASIARVSCKGMAQGQLSDLPGGCIAFESLASSQSHSFWRLDGELLNQSRGSHCPSFGLRDRIAAVLVVRDQQGCVDSQLYWVQAPKWEMPNFVIPDVITPNGDGLNDQFYVEFDLYPQGYELLIFDQLNRLVFRSEDPRESWKAQCYQTPCPAGLYRVVLTTQFEGQTQAKVNRQPLLIKK